MDENKKAIAEAEKIIAEYPRKELFLSTCQVSRDMSVGISNVLDAVIPLDKIHQGERIDFPYEILKVLQVEDEYLKLDWKDHEIFEVKLGEDIKIDTGDKASSLIPTTMWLKVSFKYITLEDKMHEILSKVIDYHKRISSCNDFLSLSKKTLHDETVVLKLIDELIKRGYVELYTLKAILTASNNWATCELMRPSFFRDILLEGIDLGCLEPDCLFSWEWLQYLAENNDPSEFMDDMDRYYDILANAVEAGNEDARYIMNRIWEPEQIIEED